MKPAHLSRGLTVTHPSTNLFTPQDRMFSEEPSWTIFFHIWSKNNYLKSYFNKILRFYLSKDEIFLKSSFVSFYQRFLFECFHPSLSVWCFSTFLICKFITCLECVAVASNRNENLRGKSEQIRAQRITFSFGERWKFVTCI